MLIYICPEISQSDAGRQRRREVALVHMALQERARIPCSPMYGRAAYVTEPLIADRTGCPYPDPRDSEGVNMMHQGVG